jgi:hypothetical protein
MSVTRDEKHGKEGAILCKQFFSNTTIQEPKNLNTALQAIEHHDDKSYKQGKTDTSSLTTILAIADDLDAFGYTGILRYAEIYILREVLLEELGERVTKNAENRFKNFKNNFKNHKSLINRHYNRLKILLDFYNNLPNKAYNKKIIELVRKNMLQNKPKSLIDLVENKEQDTKIQEFKNKLVGELNYFIRKSNSGLSSRSPVKRSLIFTGPTPTGVPVKIRSPIFKVMNCDT